MKKILKIVIPCMMLSLPFFASGVNKEYKEVNAAVDQTTDMSSISLLDGESIDTSNIIFDDFSNGDLTQNWVVSHRKWGGFDNKGVSADNVFLDTTDNKLVIRAVGNQNLSTTTVDGVGGPLSAGAVVLKQAARPGRYEAKMKPAYRVGVCNAFWTYTEDGQGNNHEIDIEFPFKDDSGNNSYDEVIFTNYIGESNFQQTHRTLDYYLNDGEYHTFAFDWYYSATHKVIKYYIDAQLLATHTIIGKLPYLPSKLWLGAWVPNNPGFVGIPDFDTCFMEIDYFKYSPFANQEAVTKGNAGGAGNSTTDYHKITSLPKYEWMSDGSFDGIVKNKDLTQRGYSVEGTARIDYGYDHTGSANSGGLKINASSSVSYKVDSTYNDYRYDIAFNYIGKASVNISTYDKTNKRVTSISMSIDEVTSWSNYKNDFELFNDSFYSIIKISNASSSDLFVDDLSLCFHSETPIVPPGPVDPPVTPTKTKIQTLSIDKTEIEIETGTSYTLNAIYTPEDVDEINLVWGSEDASVAVVSNGVVKGQKAGTTRIVVVDLVTSLRAYCTVTVTASSKIVIPTCGGGIMTTSIFLSAFALLGVTSIVIKKTKKK